MNATVSKLKTPAAPPPVEPPVDPLAKLREPFPAHQISKLPKETKQQREEREKDRSKAVKCTTCGGWHHKNAVHLDYVGHAALTDRLLDTDREWSWEPMSFNQQGLPAFDHDGGLWIKLTVCGVTRLGYGTADGKKGGDATKEVIGDALRNAAMRFGAALDLWHKGDLHGPSDQGDEAPPEEGQKDDRRPAGVVAAESSLLMCESSEDVDAWETKNKAIVESMDRDARKVVLALHKTVREKYPARPKSQPVREETPAEEVFA